MLPRRNCLILHSGALGDFVLSWPLVMALGRIHPQSRIIVVTHASKGALAEAALRVEATDIEQGWHALFSEHAQAPEPVARMLAGAHSIYSFISRDSDVTTQNLRRTAGEGAQVISLAPRPPDGYAQHATQFLVDQLKFVAPVKAGAEQMVRSINARGIGAARSDTGEILIHPGSGGEHKRWPAERFVKLIEKLKRKKKSIRVLLGEVEDERMTDAELSALASAADVLRPTSYVQLFNEIRHASVLVANDSGPGHLGGMIGVKTVSIFGATDANVWRPLGPHVKVVQGDSLEKISVDQVLHAVIDE